MRFPNYLYTFRGLARPKQLLSSIASVKNAFSNANAFTWLSTRDRNVWKRSFYRFCFYHPYRNSLFQSFHNSSIQLICKSKRAFDSGKVTLISVVKNDLDRIKMSFEHHRKIGIKQFIYLDNNSDDGTFEWLKQQDDVDLYKTNDLYTSPRRHGWINRLLSIYGFNRWYLVVDSDELFVYDNCENVLIQDFIKAVENVGQERCSGIMVDMYSMNKIFEEEPEGSITNLFRFFDMDSYKVNEHHFGNYVTGGPRARVFLDDTQVISKSPLFYFDEGILFEGSHRLYPFENKLFMNCALLHYKFLKQDLSKYKEIMEKGNYASGSIHYKKIFDIYQENKEIRFLYEGSTEYIDSHSLKKINILDKY